MDTLPSFSSTLRKETGPSWVGLRPVEMWEDDEGLGGEASQPAAGSEAAWG